MSRIDDIFNKSINSSPEADDEIQAFDPIVEHGDSRLPHTFQFSVELFYGLVGLYTDPTTLEPVEKKLKQAVKNTPLETSELYLLSDNYDSHREQFPKLYSYHYGYVVYFNMTTDDFPPFIRFINSLIFCFPKKTTIWAGITSEAAGGVSITYNANWINSARATALPDDNKEVLAPYRLQGVF